MKDELNINLVTGQDFTTNVVKGKLSGLIIDSEEKVSITIESEIGYLIYHNSQHKGVEYYAPRALLQGAKSNIIVNDQFDNFKLNERLNILVNGPANEKVKIILRFD